MAARTFLLVTVLGAALCGAASAQTILHTYTESETGARAGTSVAIWDDVNGDGLRDWVVGVPLGDGVGVNSGRVLVFSGLDNSILNTIQGTQANAGFGQAVENVGDLNGDGFEELAVGAHLEDKVYVFSGASGALLWAVQDLAVGGFGWSLSSAGDVNGDGVPDIVVGSSPNHSPGGVTALSGDTGVQIFQIAAGGTDVEGIGDVNGDGFDDVVVGSGYPYSGGSARVIGGPSGAVIYQVPYSWMSTFGYAVAGLGDIDDDGVTDFAVGDPNEFYITGGSGTVHAYSGATGSLIWSSSALGWEFGAALANAGDVDRDGYDDLIVGDGVAHRVYVFSVKRQVELFQQYVDPINHFGTSVAGGHDIDGDGWLDFIGGGAVTIFGWSPHEPTGAVLFTHGCWPDAVYNYCTAVANSTGQRAKMHWQNSTSIANNNFRLSAEKCPPNKPGLFFYGTRQVQLPIGEGHLCTTGSLQRLHVVNTGPTGTPSHTLDFTNPPNPSGQIFAGDTWHFSFWFRDPVGGPVGFNFADGLRATFCP